MNIAVLLAGGNGSRMEQTEIPKQYIPIHGKAILEYTMNAFAASESLDSILLVVDEEHLAQGKEMCSRCGKTSWCIPGGLFRSLSVNSAIQFLNQICEARDKIIISDGVRPCILKCEIEKLLDGLNDYDCVTTAIECYETLLRCNEAEEISEIIPRNGTYRQTSPEAYRFGKLQELYIGVPTQVILGYRNIALDYLLEQGIRVKVIPSSVLNFKITKQEDIVLLKSILVSGLFDEFNDLYESVYNPPQVFV